MEEIIPNKAYTLKPFPLNKIGAAHARLNSKPIKVAREKEHFHRVKHDDEVQDLFRGVNGCIGIDGALAFRPVLKLKWVAPILNAAG